MNIASMIEFHEQKRAELTMVAFPVHKRHASGLGVIEAAEDGHVIAFHEKNPNAPTMPGDPELIYANMNNYIFSAHTLLRLLREDAKDQSSSHDFGKDILPKLAGKAGIFVYDFRAEPHTRRACGRCLFGGDVGTLDVYYEASMNLRSVSPKLNRFNPRMAVAHRRLPRPAGQVHVRR